ncbi:MAG TPA: IS5 family transposase [Ktedonobacterales bacterium]|nr:IS5 family transposase [Ktedonobacterales bacterium]
MDIHPYSTTLTDPEWELVRPLLPQEPRTGRPRQHSLRTLLDAIFYAVRAGHAWRLLPQEWPPWKTVYHYFRRWRLDGTWERIHTALREALRVRVGREAQPSAAIIDSQSAKTTEQGGPHSFDGGKKINGRKRHLLVDTQGLLLKVVVHPAGVHDRVGAKQVLRTLPDDFPRLERIWADQGYAGALRTWAWEQTGIELEVVYPWWRQVKRYFPEMLEPLGVAHGFHVLPRRWVVERTFAWLGRYRRLSRDYERLCATTETLIHIAMTRLMLHRLAHL